MEALVCDETATRTELESQARMSSSVRICYTNRGGEPSERSIVPLRYYKQNGHLYVQAYCFLRHERRTFALRRMLVNAEQGGDFYTEALPADSNPRTQSEQVQEEKSQGPGPSFFGTVVQWIGALVICTVMLIGLADTAIGEYVLSSFYDHTAKTRYVRPSFAFTSSNSGSSRARTSPAQWTYRGYELQRDASGLVYVPAMDSSFSTGRQAHFAINAAAFQNATGIRDTALLHRYMNADSDGNGHLSWTEVVRFQRYTARSFVYRKNTYALNPAEFLIQGGGDCEDFALYTCGMLRFWGWNCKVGSFYPPNGGDGHAVAMVWSARPIDGYGYIYVSQGRYFRGAFMQPGYWVPIDYDSIGAFSNAMGPDWELYNLNEPEDLYGKYL